MSEADTVSSNSEESPSTWTVPDKQLTKSGKGKKKGDDPKVKTGFLTKKGKLRRNWLKRYFVLDDKNLSYYKTEKSKTVQGVLSLQEVTKVISTEHRKKPHCISLITPTRNFLFQAESEEERQSWIKAIQRQVNIHGVETEAVKRLFPACAKGRTEEVSKILSEGGIDIDVRNPRGDTAVIIACDAGNIQIVSKLLEHGASVNAQSKDGATGLLFACQNGDVSLVSFLLDNGADINSKTDGGSTPLSLASECGHLKVVRKLIESGASVNEARTTGATPLFMASLKGHVEVVDVLLTSGAEVNIVRKDGASPLHAAVQNGHCEIARLLIRSNADVNRKLNSEVTSGLTSLYIASREGRVELVKLLLNAGAHIDVKTGEGATPFFIACQEGHLPIVEILLDAGADVNAALNERGEVALHSASVFGRVSVVEKLLSLPSIDVNVQRNDGGVPLHAASFGGQNQVLDLLIASGANINSTTSDGYTPLHFACQQARLDVAEKLIESKAEINARSKNGSTPLLIATIKGNFGLRVVEKLLKAGADVKICRDDGIGPLEMASLNGDRELVRLIKKYGGLSGWVVATRELNVPDDHVLVLELHSRGVKASASINDKAVISFQGKKGMNNPVAYPKIFPEFVKRGENKLCLRIEDSGEKPNAEEKFEGWVAIRSYPPGVLQGDPCGVSYLHLEWTGNEDLPVEKVVPIILPGLTVKTPVNL